MEKNDSLKEKEQVEALKTLEKYANEDEKEDITFLSVIGGDILQSPFIMKHILWVVFVVALMILYTANRYSAQQDTLRIAELRVELQKVKYNVLTQSSELMNLTRQSNVEAYLKQSKDSTLLNPTSPPYVIK